MIVQRLAPGLCDLGRNLFGAVTGLGIDYARARQAFHQCSDTAVRRGFCGIADVGPVKTCHHDAIARNAQLLGNIVARVGVCGCGQRETRDVGKVVEQGTQQAIVRTEIMPPFRNAMRFINGKQRDFGLTQQVAKLLPRCPFRRDIKQVEVASAKPADRFCTVVVG